MLLLTGKKNKILLLIQLRLYIELSRSYKILTSTNWEELKETHTKKRGNQIPKGLPPRQKIQDF